MNRETIALYDQEAAAWSKARRPVRADEARAFAAAVAPDKLRLDIGCGTGRYTHTLGVPVVGLDASFEMLRVARREVPAAHLVQADVSALPFRPGSAAGAWAAMTYHHIAREAVPMALADLHRALPVGAPIDVTMAVGDYEGTALPGDDFPGRYFACWTAPRLAAVVEAAGFTVDEAGISDKDQAHVTARRARTLPDFVGDRMRLLFCGLNPSVYAADAGVGYARPGNRFWPAAIAAGLVTEDRDAHHALVHHRVGMTDLVKRATPAAGELQNDEYRAGGTRVADLVEWLQPDAVCFVGVTGYRAATGSKADVGPQPEPFASRPAYVMPSTSGRNAHASFDDLVAHMRAAVNVS